MNLYEVLSKISAPLLGGFEACGSAYGTEDESLAPHKHFLPTQ